MEQFNRPHRPSAHSRAIIGMQVALLSLPRLKAGRYEEDRRVGDSEIDHTVKDATGRGSRIYFLYAAASPSQLVVAGRASISRDGARLSPQRPWHGHGATSLTHGCRIISSAAVFPVDCDD